jgi:hypothetical protein
MIDQAGAEAHAQERKLLDQNEERQHDEYARAAAREAIGGLGGRGGGIGPGVGSAG